jgi:hypothetical protein
MGLRTLNKGLSKLCHFIDKIKKPKSSPTGFSTATALDRRRKKNFHERRKMEKFPPEYGVRIYDTRQNK